MALVKYASDSDANSDSDSGPGLDTPESSSDSPRRKKAKLAPRPAKALPSLPAAFHDLYASTVRASTRDHPNLHQGRRRQTPHVVGNWPSHVYVEWHPAPGTHAALASLLSDLPDAGVTSFLASDLGVPLPLHVSLSRPLALTTARKDDFLAKLTEALRATRVGNFVLRVRGLEWHRTEESARSFLVLRVASADVETEDPAVNANPELTLLLKQCNAVADEFGKPQLYRWADGSDQKIGHAFHLSIAWSFHVPTEELRQKTRNVFERPTVRECVADIRIAVHDVKVKVGNVVTPVALAEQEPRKSLHLVSRYGE